ncbi:MAG: dihydrodipicolinate synthase family protein [Acidobacteriota bacterium]
MGDSSLASERFDFDGIVPPLTTPFDAVGALDLSALAAHVERYNRAELAGYLAFGSNGEAVHLTAAERGEVLATLRRAAAPGRLIIAGVNEQSTQAAVAAAEQAADSGADAVLVITPYFYKSSMIQSVLRGFFEDVASASPLPLLIYNIPQNTGVTVAPSTLARLAEHPNIVGFKDSSGNLGALAETVRRSPSDFAAIVGNAGILYPALMMGAAGGILALACVAPEATVELFGLARSGAHEQARALQQRLSPLASLVTVELGVPGLKVACELTGMAASWPRLPLPPVDGAQRERIGRVLDELGLLSQPAER